MKKTSSSSSSPSSSFLLLPVSIVALVVFLLSFSSHHFAENQIQQFISSFTATLSIGLEDNISSSTKGDDDDVVHNNHTNSSSPPPPPQVSSFSNSSSTAPEDRSNQTSNDGFDYSKLKKQVTSGEIFSASMQESGTKPDLKDGVIIKVSKIIYSYVLLLLFFMISSIYYF